MLHWVCKEKGTMLFGGFELSQISSNYYKYTQKKELCSQSREKKENLSNPRGQDRSSML